MPDAFETVSSASTRSNRFQVLCWGLRWPPRHDLPLDRSAPVFLRGFMSSAIAALAGGFRSPFLDGLPPAEVSLILSAATQRRFSADSVVISQGQPAAVLFLLTKGRARYFYITSDGRKLLLPWIMPGEVFGGMAILSTPAS